MAGIDGFGPVEQIRAGLLDVGYVDAGPRKGPAVLLLHGWPYDIHTFAAVTPRLADAGLPVGVPYLRGYGSPPLVSQATARGGQQGGPPGGALAPLGAPRVRKGARA